MLPFDNNLYAKRTFPNRGNNQKPAAPIKHGASAATDPALEGLVVFSEQMKRTPEPVLLPSPYFRAQIQPHSSKGALDVSATEAPTVLISNKLNRNLYGCRSRPAGFARST